MSKFFVCHEPQCTEVVLNPYRHHLELHSRDLTDEAIVCLRRQSSKRELEILKETIKSTLQNGKKNAEQSVSQLQYDKPKSRKFGENIIKNVGSKKKKTLDTLPNVSAANSTQNSTEIRSLARISLVGSTGGKEKGKSCSSSAGPKRTVHKTFSSPPLSNVISAKIEKIQKKKGTDISDDSSCADGYSQLKRQKCETTKDPLQQTRKKKIQKTLKSKKGKLPSSSNLILNGSSKSKLCKISHVESLKKVESDVGDQSSSGINYIIDLADSTDQRSVASARPERRLDSLQKDKLITKIKPENEIFTKQFQEQDSIGESIPSLSVDTDLVVTDSNNTALIENSKIKQPSTSVALVTDSDGTVLIENSEIKKESSTSKIIVTDSDSAYLVENNEIKLKPSTSDNIVNDIDFTVKVENCEIEQEPTTSSSSTLQQEVKIRLTQVIKSELVSATEKDAPVPTQFPEPMQRRMSPTRLQTTPTDPSPTHTLDESGLPPCQPYCSSESSPLNTGQALERSPLHSILEHSSVPSSVRAVHPPITLSELLAASRPLLSSSNLFSNPAIASSPNKDYQKASNIHHQNGRPSSSNWNSSTPNRDYQKAMPSAPNTSYLSQNLIDCIPPRASNIHHQNSRPSSSNWNSSTPNRDYQKGLPPAPNTSYLSQNLIECIPSRASNICHQNDRPSSSNWNSSTQLLQKRHTPSKICGSPKTLCRGQLHSADKIHFSEKPMWKRSSMSRWSDLPTKLNETNLSSSESKMHCPSSVISHQLFTQQLDNRNGTMNTHLQPIHQAFGENSAKSTYLNSSNQLELGSNGSNPKIPCEQTGKFLVPKAPSPSPVHSRTEGDRAFPLPNHSNNSISESDKQLVPVETFEKDLKHSRSAHDLSQQSNHSNSSLKAELLETIALCDETSDVSSTTSMSTILTDETPVSMSRDEIMYRFLVSPYAIRHLSSCIDTSKNTESINYNEALNLQSVLMLLLFLISGGDMILLCQLTVFDVLGAQNIKGEFQVLQQSTGKTVILRNSEQSYVKNFIKVVRPALSKDSYGFLFTTNSRPFTKTSFCQALKYCWVKGQIGFDFSIMWRHVMQTSVQCKSACNNEGSQNLNISSTSGMEASHSSNSTINGAGRH